MSEPEICTDAASRRQTSTPNAVPETRTRVDASVSSAFLADMDIGAARSGERASGAVGKGGSGAVRSGGRAMMAEAQCGVRRSATTSEVELQRMRSRRVVVASVL